MARQSPFEALGAGATNTAQDMGATHYCYTLVAFRSGALGNTNLVCGIQGFSTLGAATGQLASLADVAAGLGDTLAPFRERLHELAAEQHTGASLSAWAATPTDHSGRAECYEGAGSASRRQGAV